MRKKQVIAIGLHIIFWIAIIATYVTSSWGYRNNFAEAMTYEGIFLPVRLIAVYVNWFILIPRFLYQNKIGPYIGITISFILILSITQRFLTIYWAYPIFFPHWVSQASQTSIHIRLAQHALIIMPPVAYSTVIKLFSNWYQQKNKTRQLEKEKLDAELKYLKSQINPHFLFNTLNNIYGLAREKSDKVPGLILQLSEILSFSLYEANARKIDLKQELMLIRNMINLEMDRYEKRVGLEVSIAEPPDGFLIAPLILLPLVENAFKHGVRNELGKAEVSIVSNLDRQTLSFCVQNTISEPLDMDPQRSGIGIANLRKRLNLLYPNKHELDLRRENNMFIAHLKLELEYD